MTYLHHDAFPGHLPDTPTILLSNFPSTSCFLWSKCPASPPEAITSSRARPRLHLYCHIFCQVFESSASTLHLGTYQGDPKPQNSSPRGSAAPSLAQRSPTLGHPPVTASPTTWRNDDCAGLTEKRAVCLTDGTLVWEISSVTHNEIRLLHHRTCQCFERLLTGCFQTLPGGTSD